MPGAWQPMLAQLASERYGRLLTRAMLLTGSRADAEDLVQDALVATFTGRARFGSVEQAEAYVRRSIATRFVDRTRKAVRERAALDAVAAPSSGDGHDPDLRTEVEAAMARLAPRVRACVYLRHLEGLSVAETAAALRLSEGAVKRYTSDGLGGLARLLQARWRPSDGSVPVVPRVSEVRGVTGTGGTEHPTRTSPSPSTRPASSARPGPSDPSGSFDSFGLSGREETRDA